MTHKDFVTAWLELRDTRAIAGRFGIDSHTVSNIATTMRARGVMLPKLSRVRIAGQPRLSDKLDVEALNKFINER